MFPAWLDYEVVVPDLSRIFRLPKHFIHVFLAHLAVALLFLLGPSAGRERVLRAENGLVERFDLFFVQGRQ